jgi:acetyl esterase
MEASRPRYPPEMEAVRRERAARAQPPVYDLTVEEARRQQHEEMLEAAGTPEPVARVEDLTYEGPGGTLPARLYAPANDRPPLLVYFHGGGFVLSELHAYDAVARSLVNAADTAVLLCGYRLAPEHPFPAAVEDAEAAVRWAAANSDRLGVDGGRLAVAGDSAGGNLAAVVAHRLRDSAGPPLAFQLLIYPVIQHGADTPSWRESVDALFLHPRAMSWYWDHYLPGPEHGRDPRASPLAAERFDGLPPALVIIAEHDPLRDEGEEYARRMAAAGVPVELTRYDGVVHGFFKMTAELTAAREAHAHAASALRRAFGAG